MKTRVLHRQSPSPNLEKVKRRQNVLPIRYVPYRFYAKWTSTLPPARGWNTWSGKPSLVPQNAVVNVAPFELSMKSRAVKKAPVYLAPIVPRSRKNTPPFFQKRSPLPTKLRGLFSRQYWCLQKQPAALGRVLVALPLSVGPKGGDLLAQNALPTPLYPKGCANELRENLSVFSADSFLPILALPLAVEGELKWPHSALESFELLKQLVQSSFVLMIGMNTEITVVLGAVFLFQGLNCLYVAHLH